MTNSHLFCGIWMEVFLLRWRFNMHVVIHLKYALAAPQQKVLAANLNRCEVLLT